MNEELENRSSTPIRLLIIDATLIGNGTATGELKATLLRDLNSIEVAQVFSSGHESTGFAGPVRGRMENFSKRTPKQIDALVDDFKPDCILYRPVPDNKTLHELAMQTIQTRPLPLLTWIMDDWPARLQEVNAEAYSTMSEDLHWLLRRSSKRLCISEAMRIAFQERYGLDFLPVANGIDPSHWPPPATRSTDRVIVRYAGSLAADMTLGSVVDVAQAVQKLADAGLPVRFEINTRKNWAQLYGHYFRNFASCRVSLDQLDNDEYKAFLSGADVLLIAYNFDEDSTRYVRYSLANKLPECLASGSALLVYGPAEVATVAYMQTHLPEAVVSISEPAMLEQHLRELVSSTAVRQDLSKKCRKLAAEFFLLSDQQAKLRNAVLEACREPFTYEIRRAARSEHLQIDESLIAAALLPHEPAPDKVMIDVGAHYGSSLRAFADRSWQIFAFEPDSDNRAVLERRFGNHSNVHIDPRAVSDRAESSVTFYTSNESTGIRGLLPFHESHTQAADVEVTTLTDMMHDKALEHIDFLKIDVEGYDLAVLRGFPWQLTRPAVVLCEFEDAKTLQLGHRWDDIADFLVSQRYTVYVSEWYPIVRYGTRHDWRSIRQYPCSLSDPDGWGNLIAFADPPALSDLMSATKAAIAQKAGSGMALQLKRIVLLGISIGRASLRRIRSRFG